MEKFKKLPPRTKFLIIVAALLVICSIAVPLFSGASTDNHVVDPVSSCAEAFFPYETAYICSYK